MFLLSRVLEEPKSSSESVVFFVSSSLRRDSEYEAEECEDDGEYEYWPEEPPLAHPCVEKCYALVVSAEG